MADNPSIRLNKVLRELNISLDRVIDFLSSKGFQVEPRPTTKISDEIYKILLEEFETDKSKRDASNEITEEKRKEKESYPDLSEENKEEKEKIRDTKHLTKYVYNKFTPTFK